MNSLSFSPLFLKQGEIYQELVVELFGGFLEFLQRSWAGRAFLAFFLGILVFFLGTLGFCGAPERINIWVIPAKLVPKVLDFFFVLSGFLAFWNL